MKMKMKKLLLAILFVVPLGMFAQEIRYVTVPTSQNETPAPTAYTSTTQMYQPIRQTNTFVSSNGLFRDTLKTSEKKAIQTTFLKNKLWDNWYLGLGVGLGLLMSEESRYVDTFEKTKPVFVFSLGTWVTPIVGARINVTAGKLQGFSVWYDQLYQSQEAGNLGAPHWGHGDYYIGMHNEDPLEAEGRIRTNTYLNAESAGKNIYNGDKLNYGVGQYIEETFLESRQYPRFGNSPGIPFVHQHSGAGYDYFMKYAGASFDLMLDVTTLFDRYRPNRFWHLNVFAGPGYTHTFREEKWIDDLPTSTYVDLNGNTIIEPRIQGIGETTTVFDINGNVITQGRVNRSKSAVNCIMVKTGMEMSFRLSKQLSLNLEGHAMFVPEIFDRKVGDGNTQDIVVNVFGSLNYKFKERFFYEPLCDAPQVIPIVNTTRSECCEDISATLRRIEEILLRQPAPQPIEYGPAPQAPRIINEEMERLKVIVHFIIDRWEVRQSEMYKLDEIARFMAKYPMVRVSISGYADVQTAYPAYNKRLSERRANEVARILTTKYGIDRNRLSVSFYGDTVQPFDASEYQLNRAVIAFDIPE